MSYLISNTKISRYIIFINTNMLHILYTFYILHSTFYIMTIRRRQRTLANILIENVEDLFQFLSCHENKLYRYLTF